MQRKASIYLITVIAAGGAVLPFQDWAALTSLSSEHLLGLYSLVGVAVLSELLSVLAMPGAEQTATSIGFIPYFAAVLLYRTFAAAIAVLATSSMAEFFVHRRTALKAAFNTSQSLSAIVN